MTVKQLQSLIAAGAFSASLLAGVAYADDSSTVMTSTPTAKHSHKSKKDMAKHSCAGQNSCKGQGGCKTGNAGCAAKNSCKGNGGCATDSSKK